MAAAAFLVWSRLEREVPRFLTTNDAELIQREDERSGIRTRGYTFKGDFETVCEEAKKELESYGWRGWVVNERAFRRTSFYFVRKSILVGASSTEKHDTIWIRKDARLERVRSDPSWPEPFYIYLDEPGWITVDVVTVGERPSLWAQLRRALGS
jgi:hypothetical protein